MSDPHWREGGPPWPEHDLDRVDDEARHPPAPDRTDASLDEPPAPIDWDALRREAAWDEPGSDEPWPAPAWERPGLDDGAADVVEPVAPDEAVPPPQEAPVEPVEAFATEPEAPPASRPSFETEPDVTQPAFEPQAPPAEPPMEPEPVVEPEPAVEFESEPDLEFESFRSPEPVVEPQPAVEPVPEPGPEPEPAFQPHPAFEREHPEPVAAPDEPPEPDASPSVPVPTLESGQPTVAFDAAREAWNPRLHGERRKPTTAEQAVPWLIGIILALAGIVIVLLALIFTSPGGLAGGTASPTPAPSASGAVVAPSEPSATPTPEPTEAGSPTPEASPTPSPTAAPEYGPLEMVYLGRQTALAPIYVLRRDFSTTREPVIMAQSARGVSRYAWSPDGRVGAAIIEGTCVALTPGSQARTLAENVSAVTFGWDSDTLYGVRVVRDGANDRAEVLVMNHPNATAEVLTTITYPHPAIAPDPALKEAQFIDDGGLVRIYAMADGNLAVWILGAPATYRIDPGNGDVTEVENPPTLWSPDGRLRIVLTESGSSTTIGLQDRSGETKASTQVSGLVSHIRWAKTSNGIVFTLGRLTSAGGVRQDLYVWDLQNGVAPAPLTSNGTSFGAEWVGTRPNWLP